ncbi:unnamed protein product [Caenorhabditis brenneri]
MGMAGGIFETVVAMVLEAAELRNQSLTRCQPKQDCVCWPSLPESDCPQHGMKARREPARSSNQYTPNTTALLLKVQSLFPRPEAHVNRLVSSLVDKSMVQGQSIRILPAHIEMFHRIFETYPEPFQESKKNF